MKKILSIVLVSLLSNSLFAQIADEATRLKKLITTNSQPQVGIANFREETFNVSDLLKINDDQNPIEINNH